MASIKLKFRASTSNRREGILYYQIIHKRVSRQVTTNYKLFINEWNDINETINIDYSNIDLVLGNSEKIFIEEYIEKEGFFVDDIFNKSEFEGKFLFKLYTGNLRNGL